MTTTHAKVGQAPRWMRWLAVCVWMALIFYFSSNPNSNEATKQVFGGINFYVRKLAHITEFAILFTLVRWALATTVESRREQVVRTISSFSLAFLYACSDEYHQSFVPGRSSSFGDVAIDSIGMWLAAAINFAPLAFRRKRKAPLDSD